MARHSAECDRMVEAFENANLPLFVAYYRRRLPCFLKVQELIEAGTLGQVTGVTYRLADSLHRKGPMWRTDAAVAGAGHFFDLGSHALDVIDFFLGPLTDVAGVAANAVSEYAVEDMVALSFRAAGGVVGSMACNFASAVSDDTMRIAGTEGEVAFRMFKSEPINFEGSGGIHQFDLPFPPHVTQPLIQSVVDDLLGRGACPSTGETARRTSQVMDRAIAAYYGGRDDAFWMRPETWPGRRKT